MTFCQANLLLSLLELHTKSTNLLWTTKQTTSFVVSTSDYSSYFLVCFCCYLSDNKLLNKLVIHLNNKIKLILLERYHEIQSLGDKSVSKLIWSTSFSSQTTLFLNKLLNNEPKTVTTFITHSIIILSLLLSMNFTLGLCVKFYMTVSRS